METIGFVGLGIMGAPMAGHLSMPAMRSLPVTIAARRPSRLSTRA